MKKIILLAIGCLLVMAETAFAHQATIGPTTGGWTGEPQAVHNKVDVLQSAGFQNSTTFGTEVHQGTETHTGTGAFGTTAKGGAPSYTFGNKSGIYLYDSTGHRFKLFLNASTIKAVRQ
jgi:hypothetical protein